MGVKYSEVPMNGLNSDIGFIDSVGYLGEGKILKQEISIKNIFI